MISQENQQKFEELLNEMKQLFPDTTTSMKLTITADHTKLTTAHRYAADLKKRSVTMRNIKGEWITDKTSTK